MTIFVSLLQSFLDLDGKTRPVSIATAIGLRQKHQPFVDTPRLKGQDRGGVWIKDGNDKVTRERRTIQNGLKFLPKNKMHGKCAMKITRIIHLAFRRSNNFWILESTILE